MNTVYLNPFRQHPDVITAMNQVFKFAALYAGFAFIISLVREVVKDIEDMEGDARYGCKTMPIMWGIPAAKVFVGVWMVVLAGSIAIIIIYMLQKGWWMYALYSIVLLIIPLITILKTFYKAQNSQAYHKISSQLKLVMLAGILSMLLLKIYL